MEARLFFEYVTVSGICVMCVSTNLLMGPIVRKTKMFRTNPGTKLNHVKTIESNCCMIHVQKHANHMRRNLYRPEALLAQSGYPLNRFNI